MYPILKNEEAVNCAQELSRKLESLGCALHIFFNVDFILMERDGILGDQL